MSLRWSLRTRFTLWVTVLLFALVGAVLLYNMDT